MHGRDQLDIDPSATPLAAALRALPEHAPMPDLWPDLAETLAERKRPRWRRFAIPLAAAAALAIMLLVPKLATREPVQTPIAATIAPPAPATTNAATDADELDSLHDRSRTLERWIAAVSARAPQDGRDLMAAVEVEDLIGLVDVQLGGASGDADALPLWRQRVALLEDLAAIRGNGAAFAANGARDDAPPASLNLLN
jgi:hypothetical protein